VRLLACLLPSFLPSTIAGLFACRSKKSSGKYDEKREAVDLYIDFSKTNTIFVKLFFSYEHK
jgi:hypothetical protein